MKDVRHFFRIFSIFSSVHAKHDKVKSRASGFEQTQQQHT